MFIYLFWVGGRPGSYRLTVIIMLSLSAGFAQDGTVRRIGENCQSYCINLLYKFIHKRFSAGYSGPYIMAVISTSIDITSGSQHKQCYVIRSICPADWNIKGEVREDYKNSEMKL